ncbi:MAG TPA: PQQ-binding-like beta-propeller repeat protein [Candidatus Limnocylindrales bacterium]|nr:PQQ-binding-like beta-propeller repeat protein [Candidatus Limnocylindrales bacterium]
MRVRWAGLAAATAVLLAATGVIAWRVLRPAEVSTPATTSLPEVVRPAPGALGVLISAPLVIDDRIRVYAKKREVWADGPPSYHYERSAYWAYRRWPAEVTGVLAVKADQPLVVTAWSDGALVAIEAETGNVAWRVEDGSPLGEEYDGRRTGSQTVYTPPGLFSAGPSTFVTADEEVTARSVATGQTLWTVPSPLLSRPAHPPSRGPDAPKCRGDALTTVGEQLMLLDTCTKIIARLDVSSGQSLPSMPAEAVEPVSCRVGHSDCAAMRVTANGTVTGWTLTGPTPARLAPLAAPGSLYDGQNVIVPEAGSSLSAVDAEGQALWTWRPTAPAPFRLLAADRNRVLVLESDGTLVSLNPTNGRFKSFASALMEHEPDRPYDVSQSYVSGSYVVLERTNPGVPPTADDEEYYYTNRPILIASAGA